MSRSKRKTFERGMAVEIQRDVGAAWEPATYRSPSSGMRGWFVVDMPEGRWKHIDSMSGMTVDAEHPRAVESRIEIVPSQRLRAPKG